MEQNREPRSRLTHRWKDNFWGTQEGLWVGEWFLSTNGAEAIGHPQAKKKEKKKTLDLSLTLYTKLYSEWIIDLNVEHKLINLLEENVRENLQDS